MMTQPSTDRDHRLVGSIFHVGLMTGQHRPLAQLECEGAMYRQTIRPLIPGITLSVGVAALATVLEHLEAITFGGQWLEALVLAIIVGTVVRTAWSPTKAWFAGINFSARTLLEVAVLLLGASISVQTVMAMGLDCWPESPRW
jgi:hypothetical protein